MLTLAEQQARIAADTTSSAYKRATGQTTANFPAATQGITTPQAAQAAAVTKNADRVAAMQKAAAPRVAQIKANTAMINAGQTPTVEQFNATMAPRQAAYMTRTGIMPTTPDAITAAQKAAADLGIGAGNSQYSNLSKFGNGSFFNSTKDNSVVDLKPPQPVGTKGMFSSTAQSSVETGESPTSPFAGMETAESVAAKAEQEFWGKQEADAQKYLDELTAKTKAETDANMQSWDANANAQYTEKLNQAELNTQSAIEDMMRFAGAKGSSRSSRTMDATQKLHEKGNQVKDALLAEKERERQIYQMQLAGASSEQLSDAAAQLQKAREKRVGAEAVVFAAQQGILLEQQALAASEEAQRKTEYADYLESIGMTMDPTTGETTASLKGQIDMASIQKDLAAAKKTQSEADKLQKALDNPDMKVEIGYDSAGNQIFQWYDPAKPGEIQTFQSGIKGAVKGGSAGGGGGGSGGGSGASQVGDITSDQFAIELAYKDASMGQIYDFVTTLPGSTAEKQQLAQKVQEVRSNPQAMAMGKDMFGLATQPGTEFAGQASYLQGVDLQDPNTYNHTNY